MRTIFIIASFCALMVPAFAETGTAMRLVPHRAVYDLTLVRSGSGGHGVDNASGRIAFDFGGDACEGYTVKYRQVMVLDTSETGSRTLDVRTATYESADGKTMRFMNDSQSEGRRSEGKVDGTAALKEEGLSIRLNGPKRETLAVAAKPLFPTEHMKRLIETARAGQNSLATKVYDGSDDGKRVFDTLALIGRPLTGEADGAAKRANLADQTRWPMTISYFTQGSGDQTPAYVISFELYENGISRALKLDYGDFALKGDLASLDVLPYSACGK